jgi:hypothetical protein
MSALKEILDVLAAMPEKARQEVIREANAATKHMKWVPNVGPQTECYYCEASEILFGGEPGGGKSQVLIGLALNEHERSLLLRRTNKEAGKFVGEIEQVLGTRDGFNGQRDEWKLPGKHIDLGGVQHEDDKQKYKGDPHDLIGFDELTDFTESQYMFIRQWNRSTKPGQRCRTVASSNGPTSTNGLWVITRWAAWLDPKHPNPAQSGEIRWYLVGDDGKEVEVDGPGPYTVLGREVKAQSRTFIRSKLEDNPDLAATDYGSALMNQTEKNRKAYALGDFGSMLEDHPYQVIPTEWVVQAQERWTKHPPLGVPMCSLGVDVAQGGADESVVVERHDAWFSEAFKKPGKDTPDGPSIAGMVMSRRRDGAKPLVDVGGGWGAEAYGHLVENLGHEHVEPYMGIKTTKLRTKDGLHPFANVRSAAIWKMRELLDPSQPGGSPCALPPSRMLLADLTAPTFDMTPRGIQVESKEDVCERLGRSTDEGDATVMANWGGARMASHYQQWKTRAAPPKVVMGRMSARRKA